MRILVDYRPALRGRTGAGEYVHELIRAFTTLHAGDEVTLFTSSWKDRPASGVGQALRASLVDRRVPVTVLNYLWHRHGWPPIETLAGSFDVVHAAHPLRIPARHAAQVVTIHDLFFLADPGSTRAEIRRDYPARAPEHARHAHAVVTTTSHMKRLIETQLRVPPERIYTCPAGAPAWQRLGRGANVPAEGYVLFLGTLERRKNIPTLLDAWELVSAEVPQARLVLAGGTTPEAAPWLARLRQPPLAGSVEYRGYVDHDRREDLYAGARVLVLPSLDEGFGMTALEAMSAGVPVVASSRGSLPEVVGGAGVLVDPTDARALAQALSALLTDRARAIEFATAALTRAATFTWQSSAVTLRSAYLDAIGRKRQGTGTA